MANRGHFDSERGREAGKVGGKLSPTNFRKNPKLASAAGKRSKASPHPSCPQCGKKMALSKLPNHMKDEHDYTPMDGGNV